jgi:hypothetical protein
MFMQVLIERALFVASSIIAVHLYLAGVSNLETKYMDELMEQDARGNFMISPSLCASREASIHFSNIFLRVHVRRCEWLE